MVHARPGGVVLVLVLLAAAALAGGEEPGEGALTPAEERGRHFYRTGESATGDEVVAILGDGAVEVPASSLPCSSCHGEDGRGRAEGGVVPSDLTWPALTRPYEVEIAGRRRGPYDEAKLIRSIALGIDSSGNVLDTVMPRYRMTKRDADDLVAYLKRLGSDPDPGVRPDAVRLGVLLAPEGAGDGAARSVRTTLDAFATGLNAAGGVYQRRLELVYRRLPAAPAERAAAAAEFVAAEQPFALVAPSFFGAEGELAAFATEAELPVVGPLTLAPPQIGVPGRWIFYLDPGITGMARALVRQADAAGEDGAVLLTDRDGPAGALREAALEEAKHLGWSPEEVALAADAAAQAAALAARGVERVVLLTGGEPAARFLAAARDAGWRPAVLAIGPLVGGALGRAEGFGGRLLLAFPSLPQDRTPQGVAALRRALAAGEADVATDGEAGSGTAEPPVGATEIAAYVAMDLFVEGLRHTGRDLSRTSFVEALEALRDHRTGLVPPLSYGPNRRLGTGGAWIVELGAAAAPDGPPDATWVDLVR
ncbi:MAG TPA: ABC transporter substrate-binding protein [Thermoanaerobaculia bacterium]